MRFLVLVVAATLTVSAFGQTIVPDAGGDGYRIEFWAASSGKINLDHAVTTPIPVFSPPLSKSPRFQTRNAKEFWEEFGPLRLGFGRGLVTVPPGERYPIKFPRLPDYLLGTAGLRLKWVQTVKRADVEIGLERADTYRMIVPVEPVRPPRRVAGQELLLERDGNTLAQGLDGKRLPPEQTVLRRARLVAPYEDSTWGSGGWTAELEGHGRIQIRIDPFRSGGISPTVPLAKDPSLTEASFVGREFWAYPHMVGATDPLALLQGRARLERRKVRVKRIARLWRSESLMLSGALALDGTSKLGVSGTWTALHPLVVIIEPADGKPVRADLIRRGEIGRDPTLAEAQAFSAPGAKRLYTVRVADWWHFDRALSVEGPARILKAAKPDVRRAIEQGRPLPGMTPAELGWAIGWPYDPRPREELEAYREGVWEYPMGYQTGLATFRNGRLLDYRIVRSSWPHPSLGLPPAWVE